MKEKKEYQNTYDLIHRREASYPNQIWQADHTPLDIIVLNEKGKPERPWLTIILDDYSRAVAGYFFNFSRPVCYTNIFSFAPSNMEKKKPRLANMWYP